MPHRCGLVLAWHREVEVVSAAIRDESDAKLEKTSDADPVRALHRVKKEDEHVGEKAELLCPVTKRAKKFRLKACGRCPLPARLLGGLLENKRDGAEG